MNDELNTGNFKEVDSDRHFQILSSYLSSRGYHTNSHGRTPNPLYEVINEEFPEVDYVVPVLMKHFYESTLVSGENNMKAMPQFIGPGYFNLFPAHFIEGDKTNVLADKNEVVISEQMATGLFQSTKEAMGQTVTFKNKDGFDGTYVVSGVFERPRNSLAQFDVLFSYKLFRDRKSDLMNWYNGGTQVHFAGVAIAISCLGLLALTAFSTQRRFKEIAIRKVLGSTRLGIINLLSREFILLVVLAILVALPVGYYLMQSWLDSFAYRINLSPMYFILASLLMLLMAWFTVVVQAACSSKVNVSESLRGEVASIMAVLASRTKPVGPKAGNLPSDSRACHAHYF